MDILLLLCKFFLISLFLYSTKNLQKRKQEEKAERERQKAREERLRKREEMIAERQYQEERKKQQLIEARANRAKKITAEGRSESLDTLLQTSQKEAEVREWKEQSSKRFFP